MENRKYNTLLGVALVLVLGGCSSTPEPRSGEGGAKEVKTLMGYTIQQARQEMSMIHDPNDISISFCSSEDGRLIHELNQLRMRMINDYNGRMSRQFIQTYNRQTLYPRTKPGTTIHNHFGGQ